MEIEIPLPYQLSDASVAQKKYQGTRVLYGFRKDFAVWRIWWAIFILAAKRYSNPLILFRVMRGLESYRRSILGNRPLKKIVRHGGRLQFELYTPGFPSPAFDNLITAEMERIVPIGKPGHRLGNVLVGITKKCNLKCEHCLEWNELNKPEKFQDSDLQELMKSLYRAGTAQIHLAGGEPMLRFEELPDLLQHAPTETDIWLLSNGYHLDRMRAGKLKQDGLHGVIVSLDHYDPAAHNLFRGNSHAFDWVMKAVESAQDAGLATALTVCVTRKTANPEFLMRYAELARKLKVGFIQLLEPVAIGHYAGMDVTLNESHKNILEQFYLNLNYDSAYSDFPLVCYHGYYQRNAGCLSAGTRNLYVDTNGEVQACPFCRKSMGNILEDGLERALQKLNASGCPNFETVA